MLIDGIMTDGVSKTVSFRIDDSTVLPPNSIIYSPIGVTRTEQTPWAEWYKTVKTYTSYNGIEYMGHQHHGVAHSIQHSQNKKIIRFEVHEGEGRDTDREANNDRSELGMIKRVPYGQDNWFAFSLRIEDKPLLNDHSRVVITQFHGHTGSPSMSLRIGKGKFQVQALTNVSGSVVTTLPYSQDMLETNKWHHIVGRSRFGTKNNAILEVWLNGEKIVDRKNYNMGYTTGSETYYKFGVYRNRHPGVHILEFANMELGQSSLLDRVQNPTPIIP
jgi:hypothetical protein